MIFEIMRYCRNFFARGHHTATWSIENGSINLPFLANGQLFVIEGSVFNDGAYRYGECGQLIDETFTGDIIECAPPQAFLDLCDEIKAFQKTYKPTEYHSESFGGYSYTKGTESGWQSAFANRLKMWRKI